MQAPMTQDPYRHRIVETLHLDCRLDLWKIVMAFWYLRDRIALLHPYTDAIYVGAFAH